MKKYGLNMKRKVIIFFSIWTVFLFLGHMPSVYAVDDSPGAAGFTYSVNYPENQVDKDLGYYKLKMQPGQNQQLSIMLSNPGTEKVTIDVNLNGAKTNQNGVIEYGDSTIENDKSLKFAFTDIVKAPESVDLAPGETKSLDISVTMPETEFDGVIAGGIQLMRVGQEETSNTGGSKIVNQYAYITGVVLQENDNPVVPDLELNSVKAGQSNYRNAVFINYSNINAAYLDDMTTEVQITEKGKSTVLYERKQTAMRMAPNSFINFPVSMNGERMVAGKYEADILVTSGEKKWTWKKEFTITNEEANKFNERDVGLVQEKKLDWKLIIMLVAIFIVVIFVIVLIVNYLKKNKKKNKNHSDKKKKQPEKKAEKTSSKKKKKSKI